MSEQTKTKEPRLIVGVMVLMISNIIVKLIGVLFKIPLHNLLGDAGMGYFNAAYSVFTTLYLVSTSGLPTAISMIVSRSRILGRKKQVNKIFSTALLIFVVVGTLGSCLMFFGSSVIAEMMGSPGAAQSINDSAYASSCRNIKFCKRLFPGPSEYDSDSSVGNH